uniref:Uncharacterized protein n=1 Tax=Cajanus cajan TaxID=3821 RepID=A0A151SIK6_CAJCA|nr:hypothetical protein KK1_000812 [Cajanus cajan]
MEWSAKSATRAYLDTLQLCSNHKRQNGTWRVQNPGSNEFVSALGMKAKLLVEVTSHVSLSTIALAVAASQTGGKFVCILPESVLDESKEVINNSGLEDQVEFITDEDPSKLLSYYQNIDFFLVDCKDEDYTRLLNLVDVNLTRSIVVAKNLVGGDKKKLRWCLRGKNEKLEVRSLKHPVENGMEVIWISKNDDTNKGHEIEGDYSRKRTKSSWIAKFDEESGEEHIYRVPHVDWF